jgi:hypothetical protein
MIVRTLMRIDPAPLRVITGEAEPTLLDALPAWAWIAMGVALLIALSLALVRTLGRDRSDRAEASRAFDALARAFGLAPDDRRLITSGARDAGVRPVACLLSSGAFDTVRAASPREFDERFAELRRTLFPHADASEAIALEHLGGRRS